MVKKVISIGGGNKSTRMPDIFNDYEKHILDIDPSLKPDILMDARDLVNWKGDKYDAVYSSHNLEHFRHYDVMKVLDGINHLLKPEGFFLLVVPNAYGIAKWMVENNGDFDSVVYEVPRGVVTVRDMIWGHAGNVRITADEWYLHKTGFSKRTLSHALYDSAFKSVQVTETPQELIAVAWKEEQTTDVEINFT